MTLVGAEGSAVTAKADRERQEDWLYVQRLATRVYDLAVADSLDRAAKELDTCEVASQAWVSKSGAICLVEAIERALVDATPEHLDRTYRHLMWSLGYRVSPSIWTLTEWSDSHYGQSVIDAVERAAQEAREEAA